MLERDVGQMDGEAYQPAHQRAAGHADGNAEGEARQRPRPLLRRKVVGDQRIGRGHAARLAYAYAHAAQEQLAEAARRGLVLLSCGTYGNVIRILVPLTASDALIEEGLAILAESFKSQR